MTKKSLSNVLKFPNSDLNPRRMSKKKKDQLILEYMPLVRFVAKKFYHRTPPNVEMDDLVSCGVIGLMDAIKKFNPQKGVKFKTYAEHRIRGSILDELRRQDWIPRSIRSKEKLVEKSITKLENVLGRDASMEELSKVLKMKKTDFYKLLNTIKPATVVRLEDYQMLPSCHDNSGLSMRNIFSKNPQDRVSFANSCRYISRIMKNLTDNEQSILNLYYFENKNLKEISKLLGITESRVSQLHMRAKSKMKDYLSANFNGHDDLAA